MPKRKFAPLTEEEIIFMKENHQTMTNVDIGRHLNKNKSYISREVRKLGLTGKYRGKFLFTEEALDFIRKNYVLMSNQELADHLKKERRAIAYALCKLLKVRRPAKHRPIEVGHIFGRLIVLEQVENIDNNKGWLCQCQCGNQIKVPSNSLKKKTTRSCGCLGAENRYKSTQKLPGETSYTRRFNTCRRNALSRGIEFNLTFDEWKSITSFNCIYCDAPPIFWNAYLNGNGKSMETRLNFQMKKETIDRATIYISGVDRANSSKGYDVSNCVPTCFPCNSAKLDYSVEEFVAQTKARFEMCGTLFERIEKFTKKKT